LGYQKGNQQQSTEIKMTKSDMYEAIGAMLNEAKELECGAIASLEGKTIADETRFGLSLIDKACGLRQAAAILIAKQAKAEAAFDAKYQKT